jgi:dual specificity protein kinase YAK1
VCNPKFRLTGRMPQRVLTNPSVPRSANGLDNEDGNLICKVADEFIPEGNSKHAHRYTVIDLLGTGTFGQVFRCQKNETGEIVAVKVIKNKAAYNQQGLLEIKIAKLLNHTFDPANDHHIVRLHGSFEAKGHLCLVFELLGMSLLDVLTHNQFRGLPLKAVQRITRQILLGMSVLQEANVIHCDLKPGVFLEPDFDAFVRLASIRTSRCMLCLEVFLMHRRRKGRLCINISTPYQPINM